MSTQSNAANELPLEARATVQTVISPGRRLYWSVQRELWEHRGFFVALLAVAAFVIFGVILGVIRGTVQFGVSVQWGAGQHRVVSWPIYTAQLALMGIAFLVAILYSATALHGERRDRSVLFWKSLPVSDLTTVLAKATIPILAIPAFTMALIMVTHILTLLIFSVAHLAAGQSVASAWTQANLPHLWLETFYHLITIHVLWYAPIYGYLLMISAWAKRGPLLWAVLPLVAVTIVEKIAFGTKYFASFLGDRLTGNSLMAGHMLPGMLPQISPLRFLASPGLWLGLVAAVIFLAAAVRLRREQAPV